ncbi:MAG: HD domain-containing protein [Deltaproteobacteria bacterium]|jgi:3'-5' exoribonuclease|nr:HD domain-containing protein [Deltaproteobacteria bacterium]
MEKKQFVAELEAGGQVDGIFLLAAAQQNQARNGPYWRVEFRDTSGKVEGKIWSPLAQNFPDLKAGALVEVQGRVVVYRERNEIAVDAMRLLEVEERDAVNLADFVASSRHDSESMLTELEALCRETFSHKPWIKFYRNLLRNEEIISRLRISPAAKAMHHAYAGGLLEHTLSVCRLCLCLADLYPQLDRQVLLAGALCHDLGKIWELSSGLVVDYTSTGRLLGHIGIAVEKIEPLLQKSGLEPELAEHLKHLLLSHHGTREFGSPTLPATAEAMALHYADNLDAKLNQVQQALEGVPADESGWSSYVPGLERALFRAVASPEAVGVRTSARAGRMCRAGGADGSGEAGGAGNDKTSGKAQETQCSLLSKA